MKKVFISMPMRNRTKENIEKSIEKAKQFAKIIFGEDVEFIHTEVKEKVPYENGNQAIYCLSKSLEILSQADAFVGVDYCYFISSKGCEIEKQVFEEYGSKRDIVVLPLGFVFSEEEIKELEKKYNNEISDGKCYCTRDRD